MSQAELFKISNGRNEVLDEMMMMFSPEDAGKKFYNKVCNLYETFGETGDMQIFEKIVDELYKITGYRF